MKPAESNTKNSEQVVAGEIPPCLQVESDISKGKKLWKHSNGAAWLRASGVSPPNTSPLGESKFLGCCFFLYGGWFISEVVFFIGGGRSALTSSAYDCANKIPKSIPQIK